MAVNSWHKNSFSKLKFSSLFSTTTAGGTTTNINDNNSSNDKKREEEQLYGITEQLIAFAKSFSIETFKNFSIPDEKQNSGDGGNVVNVHKDLSAWQERHAVLVLSRVKELAQLRFKICPRHMKESHFWRIYFTLVRSYVTEYELCWLRLEKLKQIRVEAGMDYKSGGSEVEMSEAKFIMPKESAASTEHK